MDNITSKAIDNGVARTLTMFPGLSVKCGLLMLMKKMENFIFFPAKDCGWYFRIGVAISDSPIGPFKLQSKVQLKGSFSDPAVFEDDDNSYYMFWWFVGWSITTLEDRLF